MPGDRWPPVVVRTGLVPYGEALAAPEARSRPRGSRATSPTCSCSWSTRPSTRGAPLDTRTSCRWARSGTGRRASRCVDTDRGGRVTYHGPGQLVGYPIMSLQPLPATTSHGYIRRMERLIIAALADWRDRGRPDRRPDRRLDARAAQDRLDRHPRQPRHHDARLRDQRQQRPRSRSSGSCPAASRPAE